MKFPNIGLVLLGSVAISALTYLGCTHSETRRHPASYTGEAYPDANDTDPVPDLTLKVLKQDVTVGGGQILFPPGLSEDEAIDLWHLSEGSEVFPLTWFMKLKSQRSHFPGSTYLYEALDKKFGVIREPQMVADHSPFPFKWIGITSTWSGANPDNSDVRVSVGQPLSENEIQSAVGANKNSVAMVGVNCAFCHTNQIQVDGKMHLIEGAPNMVHIRGFFEDLFGSTAETMLVPQLLEDFFRELHVQGDIHAKAAVFSKSFQHDLGLDGIESVVAPLISQVDNDYYESERAKTLATAFYKKKETVIVYLNKLLQITYGFKTVPVELQLRMRFLAGSIGVNPGIALTPEGYARTDAFGRIANLVARIKDPIPLTATASVPPMWNIKYHAFFHWNANTNSAVMRNIGQSFGLGAILTNPKGKGSARFDATVNLHNLHRLEELVYKIQAPRLQEYTTEIDIRKAVAGCNLYQRMCAECHTVEKDRVGPTHELVAYKMIPQYRTMTDPTYNDNQSKPVDGVPFKDALFSFARAVRSRYYERYNVPAETQEEWEHRALRGPELFRDTSLGESGNTGVSTYMNVDKGIAYPARPLASAWATAPYLHNGSVPSVWDLLHGATLRPKVFFVGSREFDPVKLGFKSGWDTLPPIPNLDRKAHELMHKPPGIMSLLKGIKVERPKTLEEAKIQVACNLYPERCFFVSETGNSNMGHEGPEFGTFLDDDQRHEIIEFLKVLRAEPEFSDKRFAPIYSTDGKTCQAL